MSDLPQGPDISSYRKTPIDVDTAKRNFPGYAKEYKYSLADIIKGDSAGTTDTDSKTHEMGYNKSGYTRIYQ